MSTPPKLMPEIDLPPLLMAEIAKYIGERRMRRLSPLQRELLMGLAASAAGRAGKILSGQDLMMVAEAVSAAPAPGVEHG
jgi:hypothetical protein